VHECTNVCNIFHFWYFWFFCLILTSRKRCMSILRTYEHYEILWWFMRMYVWNAYLPCVLIEWMMIWKCVFFYSWLNGNVCIKLHFSLLIFNFFFCEYRYKILFFVLKKRMHIWMHKNSILFFNFNWKIMHACIKFY